MGKPVIVDVNILRKKLRRPVFANMKRKQNKFNQSPLSKQQERGTVLDKKENHLIATFAE